MAHITSILLNSIESSIPLKKRCNKDTKDRVDAKDKTIHLCVLCFEPATVCVLGQLQTKFINCKLQYLTYGDQVKHRSNDKAICKKCRRKLKEQQNNFKFKKKEHCPFCRSHDPLAKPPILLRMPKKKKTFAEAEFARIKKISFKFEQELQRRAQLNVFVNKDDILMEPKFRLLLTFKIKNERKHHYKSKRIRRR
jgi:hypothetical protein